MDPSRVAATKAKQVLKAKALQCPSPPALIRYTIILRGEHVNGWIGKSNHDDMIVVLFSGRVVGA